MVLALTPVPTAAPLLCRCGGFSHSSEATNTMTPVSADAIKKARGLPKGYRKELQVLAPLSLYRLRPLPIIHPLCLVTCVITTAPSGHRGLATTSILSCRVRCRSPSPVGRPCYVFESCMRLHGPAPAIADSMLVASSGRCVRRDLLVLISKSGASILTFTMQR
ncbi:hypothetical protein BHM03_00055095 [Ensete ventricosum]|uniref:Uncharacterized protein n=1 Tax=Ensete ventricosum TaxID=4639 RepID=A0A426X9A0_ENSVE|nr:hypothetical protein B296_00012261 [Ensete ventricosum]RZS22340.1 hypothetical protein BHM03_00055095 [Ensete ventricosum]